MVPSFIVSGFMVSGLRFVNVPLGARFAQFGSLEGSVFQIFDKVIKAARECLATSNQALTLALRDVTQVKGYICLRPDFAVGSLGHVQEINELPRRPPLETLGDVRHRRDRRPLHLAGKPIPLMSRKPSCKSVHEGHDLPRLLPHPQILEALNCRHRDSFVSGYRVSGFTSPCNLKP
jgi:hypothetical protein